MLKSTMLELPDFYNPIQYSIAKRPFFRFDFPGLDDIQVNFSQLHQDMFVLCALAGKRGGCYLEIGSHEPIFISNTYLLEQQFGWQGLGLELDEHMVARHRRLRRNPCLLADALTVDYEACMQAAGLPAVLDYLSLDIDPPANSLKALMRLPHQCHRFRVITFEHDLSLGGSTQRLRSRQFLRKLGYELVLGDVSWGHHVVEDWWVDPALTNPEDIQRLKPSSHDCLHPHDSFFYNQFPAKKTNDLCIQVGGASPESPLGRGICVEGWRDLNHSFSLVNQWQLLELLNRPVRLWHRDIALPPGMRWNTRDNPSGLPAELQNLIRSVPSPGDEDYFSVIYRIGYPFNLANGRAERILVFGTSECGGLRESFIGATPEEATRRGNLVIVTPSRWSKEGFMRSGFDDASVFIVPHGVSPEAFYQVEPSLRSFYRQVFGFGEGEFVLLNVGGTSAGIKGLDLLLIAYAQLKARIPKLKLVIKCQYNLYGRTLDTVLHEMIAESGLPGPIAGTLRDEVVIISDNLDLQGLMALYNACDLYVSPYRAEGFNIPPLEAAACGLPILVTAGGATDEYYDPRLGLQISSKLFYENGLRFLVPDIDSLRSGIEAIVREPQRWGGSAGSEWVHSRHSWRCVGQQLWDLLAS